MTGRREFSFDTGGPSIRASLPDGRGSTIDADQVFVLALDAPAAVPSIVEHAACAVDNVAERIPVDVLAGDAREQVLAQRAGSGIATGSCSIGDRERRRRGDPGEAVSKLESRLVVLRCRRSLPPDVRVSLVWGRGIATAERLARRAPTRSLSFQTRLDFTVRIECERVNANAPCLPMRPVRDRLLGACPGRRLARNIAVTDGSGRKYSPIEFSGARTGDVESPHLQRTVPRTRRADCRARR